MKNFQRYDMELKELSKYLTHIYEFIWINMTEVCFKMLLLLFQHNRDVTFSREWVKIHCTIYIIVLFLMWWIFFLLKLAVLWYKKLKWLRNRLGRYEAISKEKSIMLFHWQEKLCFFYRRVKKRGCIYQHSCV